MMYCSQCGVAECKQHPGDGPWCSFCGTLNRKCEHCKDREPVPYVADILAARIYDQERRIQDLEKLVFLFILSESSSSGALQVALVSRHMDQTELNRWIVTNDYLLHRDLILAAHRIAKR